MENVDNHKKNINKNENPINCTYIFRASLRFHKFYCFCCERVYKTYFRHAKFNHLNFKNLTITKKLFIGRLDRSKINVLL